MLLIARWFVGHRCYMLDAVKVYRSKHRDYGRMGFKQSIGKLDELKRSDLMASNDRRINLPTVRRRNLLPRLSVCGISLAKQSRMVNNVLQR